MGKPTISLNLYSLYVILPVNPMCHTHFLIFFPTSPPLATSPMSSNHRQISRSTLTYPQRATHLPDGHRLPRLPRAAVAWAFPPPPSPNPGPTPRRAVAGRSPRWCRRSRRQPRLCRSPRGAATAPHPLACLPRPRRTTHRTCPTRSSCSSSRRLVRRSGMCTGAARGAASRR